MLFCPRFYYASVGRTWADPLVFQELNSQPEELLAQTFEKIPSSIRQRYSRGVDAAGSLLVGFVLLKRKKTVFERSHHHELSPFPTESASVSMLVQHSTDVTHCLGRLGHDAATQLGVFASVL